MYCHPHNHKNYLGTSYKSIRVNSKHIVPAISRDKLYLGEFPSLCTLDSFNRLVKAKTYKNYLLTKANEKA